MGFYELKTQYQYSCLRFAGINFKLKIIAENIFRFYLIQKWKKFFRVIYISIVWLYVVNNVPFSTEIDHAL